MRLTAKPLAAILLAILFGGIGFSSAMGWWQTASTKTPARFSDGEAAGEYDPADIRGSYTFGEVADLFAVPLEDLAAAFRIPQSADPAAYPLKSLESQFSDLPVEVGTASVRLFVAFYRGLPIDLAEEPFLPADAVRLLEAKANLSDAQRAYLVDHQIALVSGDPQPVGETQAGSFTPPATPQVTSEEHTPAERTVTGKTSFQDLLDWGVSAQEIEQLIGSPLPDPRMLVKDYSNQAGLSFPTLKSQLQALLEQGE